MSVRQDKRQVLPAQHQEVQPGRETAMTPRPDHSWKVIKEAGSYKARWRW